MKNIKIATISFVVIAILILQTIVIGDAKSYTIGVTGDDGKAIPDARVTLTYNYDDRSWTQDKQRFLGQTDKNGRLNINMNPGTYQMIAHAHYGCWLIPNKEYIAHGRSGWARITCGPNGGYVGTIKVGRCVI
jgi:hypothetical protein